MKRWMICSLLYIAPLAALAQGYYEPLRYRMNDPFVFCRHGMDQKPRAWSPLPPYTGPWMPTPGYCPMPTPNCGNYLKGWSFKEIDAWNQYVRVCPRAESSGKWDGSGDGSNVPFKH